MSKTKNKKIEVRFSNVGGFTGELVYSFEVGKLHEIRGANTAGKSSLFKAIVAPLSVPSNADFRFEEEAELFGIKQRRSNISHSFVNNNYEKAQSTVLYDNKKWDYKVKNDGSLLEIIPKGNDDFLLVGVLSRNTKLYQQIIRGNWEFKWFIDELSAAKRYDSIANIISIRRRETERGLIKSKKSSEKMKTLSSEVISINKELKDKKDSLEKLKRETMDLDELIQYNTELSSLDDQKTDLKNRISGLNKSLRSKENQKSEYINKLKIEEKENKKRSNNLEKIKTRLKEIGDLNERQIELKKYIENSEVKKRGYATKRDEISGVINLLTLAQNSLKTDSPKCPLCNSLDINHHQLNSRLKEYRREYSQAQAQVSSIVKEQDIRQNEMRDLVKEKEELENKEEELNDENINYIKDIQKIEKKLNISIQAIKEDTQKIEKAQSNLSKVNSDIERILKKSEKGKKLAEEKGDIEKQVEKLEGRLLEIEKQLDDLTVEFWDYKLNPDIAMKIFSKLKEDLMVTENKLNTQADIQRREAQKVFNETISEVLKRLKFKDLGRFSLNSEYLLIRQINGKLQDMESLAESERVVLAIVLLLSAKRVYYSEIPLFLIDDVYNDLDDEKKKLLTNYLIEIASNENIAILYTCLDDSLSEVEINVK